MPPDASLSEVNFPGEHVARKTQRGTASAKLARIPLALWITSVNLY